MNHRGSRLAYTMIEMLIVIAIIAVLAGMIVSYIQRAREAMARTTCANNLHNLGIAYTNFVDAKGGKPAHFKGDSGWTARLKPYVENDDRIFLCVTSKPTKTKERPPLDLAIYSYAMGRTISLTPRATIYCRIPGYQAHVPFNTPWTPQFEEGAFKIEADFTKDEWNRPAPGGFWVFVVATPFIPGDYPFAAQNNGQPQTKDPKDPRDTDYYWWRDLQCFYLFLLIEPQPDGSIHITNYAHGSPVRWAPRDVTATDDVFDLVRESTKEVLIPDFYPYGKLKPFHERPHHVIPSPDKNRVLADYGVNSKSAFFAPAADSSKVLLLEYKKPVAKLTGTDGVDLALWPKLAAPRHSGMLNVLFRDGHVNTVYMPEIDPGVTALNWQYWLPQRLQRGSK